MDLGIRICAKPGCGCTFKPYREHSIYCTQHRYLQSDSYRLKLKLEKYTCEICGAQFRSGREDAKYCQKHKHLYRDKKVKPEVPAKVSKKKAGKQDRIITSTPVFTPAQPAEVREMEVIKAPEVKFTVRIDAKTVYTFDDQGRYERFLKRMGMKKPG